MKIPSSLHDQIKSAWAKINQPLSFVVYHQAENSESFHEFFEDASQLSDSISYEEREGKGELRCEIFLDNEPTGLVFQGIPLGHELTSFVLAPLAITHQAQMPDETTLKRIHALPSQIDIVSYISLSCENCPIVVQALNMMAAINPNITHTMVDGALYPEQMKAMGILSVPTVKVNGEDFVTGRQDFSSLLNKLEEKFAGEQEETVVRKTEQYDVVVVGSGPAGVSSAIYTARKGLRTAVVTENIGGLVRETKGIENLISTPYIEGPQLAQNLKEHLLEYKVDIFENQRVERVQNEGVKKLALKGGLELETKALIAATGAKWRELNVPGEKEYLGRGVAFCPHCDGPFYKEKEIAVIGGGNSGVEAALDLAGICKKVTVFEYGSELKADKVLLNKLNAHEKIDVVTHAQTLEIRGDGESVKGLSYKDLKSGEEKYHELEGVFIQIGLVPNSEWIKDQVETTTYGEIVIDERTNTSAEGIFAAGDVSTVPYKQIVIAMGEGAKAGLAAFEYFLKLE